MMNGLMSFEDMENIDVRTVDRETLIDITSVRVNLDLPQMEKMVDYIYQIKNPHCFKYGKLVVQTSFSKDAPTLENTIINCFSSSR